MTCRDCSAAAETKGHWRLFNTPQCLYCTARLIQQIGKLASPSTDAITARRRAAIADAVAFGLSEQEIRDLAALKEMALQPVEVKRK